MATAINFTKEHLDLLKEKATKALFSGVVVKGKIGTNLNIFDLFHNTTINSLIDLHRSIKKEVDTVSNTDQWSMNDYQQKKLNSLKDSQELVNLLIGYKKHKSQINDAKEKLAELRAKQTELQESQMTPEDKLKAISAEIDATSALVEEEF